MEAPLSVTDDGPTPAPRKKVGHDLSIRPRPDRPGPAGGWNIDVFLDGQKMLWQTVELSFDSDSFASCTLKLLVDSVEVDAEVIPRLVALIPKVTE